MVEMTAYDFYRIASPGVGMIGIHLYTSVQRLVKDGFVEELYQLVRVTKGIA